MPEYRTKPTAARMVHREERDHHVLHFIFQGHFDLPSCQRVINQWRHSAASNSDKPIKHIWECLDMRSFDNSARKLWMKQLAAEKKQTESILLVADNTCDSRCCPPDGTILIYSAFCRYPPVKGAFDFLVTQVCCLSLVSRGLQINHTEQPKALPFLYYGSTYII